MNDTAPPPPLDALDRARLIDFFERAERPADRPERIGLEQELFAVALDEGGARPVTYREHVAPMLGALIEQFGWAPGMDRGSGGEIISLVRDSAAITLEPGGQIELSGAPLATLHETCVESTRHHRELHAVAAPMGVAFMAAGFHPFARHDEFDWMPKDRYRQMREYLPTRGARALDMMLRTCTLQANLDYANERECGERFRLALALSAPFTAMFANSPFVEGRPSGSLSSRSQTWEEVDPARCGMPRFAFEGAFTYERYVDWALGVPMFFIKRAGAYLPYHATFAHFLAHGLTDDTGVHHHATWSDWELHLTTLFPEVRLKPFVEIRGGDVVTPALVCAMPALWKGILYDQDATVAAWELVRGSSYEDRVALALEARTRGLAADRVWQLARAMLGLAEAGLARILAATPGGEDEQHFLEPLRELVDARTTLADRALAAVGQAAGRSPAGRRAFVNHYWVAGAHPPA